MVSHDTPTSSIDGPFAHKKNIWNINSLFSIASFLVSSIHETFVEESRWFGRGAIVESVYIHYSVKELLFPARLEILLSRGRGVPSFLSLKFVPQNLDCQTNLSVGAAVCSVRSRQSNSQTQLSTLYMYSGPMMTAGALLYSPCKEVVFCGT